MIDGSSRFALNRSRLDREISLDADLLATLCARDTVEIECIDRFFASSVCARLEWLGCRRGIAGDSDRGGSSSSETLWCLNSSVDTDRRRVEAPLTAGVRSKVIFFSSIGDATGEFSMLDASVNSASRLLLEVDDASSTSLASEEDPDETLDDALRCAWMTAMSGALYVSMLVVLNSCTGPEIFLMSTDFLLYLMLAERGGDGGDVASS